MKVRVKHPVLQGGEVDTHTIVMTFSSSVYGEAERVAAALVEARKNEDDGPFAVATLMLRLMDRQNFDFEVEK